MLLKGLKWLKAMKSEVFQDVALDLVLGSFGIIFLNISYDNFVKLMFQMVLILGDKF